jgi:hypothetical protein
MSQNAEAAINVDYSNLVGMDFSWSNMVDNIFNQNWDIYSLDLADTVTKRNPGWTLLYDEVGDISKLEDEQEVTMVITLSRSDTARIQATSGTNAGKGTQYFWLSKGTFDFFPALVIKNNRGTKDTFSCFVNINYIDLCIKRKERVTFEADNNLDFRLGTGALRYKKIAAANDLALITRISEYDYELRIIKANTRHYAILLQYATAYIGNFGKRFGYIGNDELNGILST